MAQQPGTVFVSHASDDREFVRREILEPLRSRGIPTWYSADNIPTAAEWQRSIVSALEQCDRFLVVLSPRAVESRWVRAEVDWALEHRPGRVIPVIMESCDVAQVHLVLRQVQQVNFETNSQAARHQLLKVFFPDSRHMPGDSLPEPVFHFGGVVPPEFFVGREQQLHDAERIIRSGQNFLLVGQHRDGKTSLCKMLIHRMMGRPDNRVLAVYVNVQTWPDVNIETFLEHTILSMIGEVARQVFRCPYTALSDASVEKAPEHLRQDDWFRALAGIYKHARGRTSSRRNRPPRAFQLEDFQFLHGELLEVIQAKGWSHCVVFYDEANRLTSDIPVEQLVSHEEALTVPGRISVYAATPAMARSFGRLKDTFAHEVLLPPFTREQVEQLLSSYCCGAAGRTVDLPVTSEAVEQMWKETLGQPYRVQLLAGRSFAIARNRGAVIVSLDDVTAALKALKSEPGEFARPSK